MILSVSRRTDIPNYYSDWFFRRLKEGYLYVRNPMNVQQISRVELSPEVVDCVVFWTKDPTPMLERLDEMAGYPYLFQYTVTEYGEDIEPRLYGRKQVIKESFRALSKKIGSQKVIWRYDPIIVNEIYTLDFHRRAFQSLAGEFGGYTQRCMISFVDFYEKNRMHMNSIHLRKLNQSERNEIVSDLAAIGAANGIQVMTCCEDVSEDTGVVKGSCIDKALIESVIGCSLKSLKGKALREGCQCMESVEVGSYDTCKNGCIYCYANNSRERVEENVKYYNAEMPILCGGFLEDDILKEKKMRSLREDQIELWDFLE